MNMHHHQVVTKLTECGVVAVVRAESAEEALQIADACLAGGLTALEITFTVPGADRVIAALAAKYKAGEMVIGAGTVLDPETARIAILAGAKFVVSPALNTETAKLCNRYQVPYLPGAATIKEIVESLEAGAAIVKVFPGEMLGPGFIKAVHGPLPYAPLMPTGGVTIENAKQWIDAGAVALGVGGNLTKSSKSGDYATITKLAAEFVSVAQTARKSK